MEKQIQDNIEKLEKQVQNLKESALQGDLIATVNNFHAISETNKVLVNLFEKEVAKL